MYKNYPALYALQFDTKGFEWIDLNHRQESVIVYKRKGLAARQDILVVLNMTPTVHHNWTIEVKGKSDWKEIFNSDAKEFWGTGDVYNPLIKVILIDKKTKTYQLKIDLPPLAGIVLG